MTTQSSRGMSAVARLFRSIPAETLKATIEDIEDEHSPGGDTPITRQEANAGGSEDMRGGNAAPMVRAHSDLAPQRGRQAEYDSFSGILTDIKKALEALSPKAAVKAVVDAEPSYLAVVEKSLKIAGREIFKAEAEDDDEDEKKDAVEKAERYLAKAARLLAKAEEDEKDEDEDRIEKARATLRKSQRALKPFKDAITKADADKAAAAVAKAEADKAAALAKAEEDKKDEKKDDAKKEDEVKKADPVALQASIDALQSQFGIVTKSVSEVMEMVAGASRSSSTPPGFVAKAVAPVVVEPMDFAARAEEAADNNRITGTELMKCHNVISRLTIAKSGDGGVQHDLAAIKADLANASSGVREVFASLLTA